MSQEPSNQTLAAMITDLKELFEVRFTHIESLHKQHIEQDNRDHADLKEHILRQNGRIGKNERKLARIVGVGSVIVIILPVAVSLLLGLMNK